MSRSELGIVAVSVFFVFGTIGSSAQAFHGKRCGGQGNFGSTARHAGSRVSFGNARGAARTRKAMGGEVLPIRPAQPSGPIAGLLTPPAGLAGPITPPIEPTGPIKPPASEQTITLPVATTNIATHEPAIAPAEAASPSDRLPEVAVGSTLVMTAKNLGTTGQALLVIDKLTLSVQVEEWTADHATATLPKLAIRSPVLAEIVLVKADGYAASKVKVKLLPALDEQNDTLATVASLTQ
jgi:hypothetical protein